VAGLAAAALAVAASFMVTTHHPKADPPPAHRRDPGPSVAQIEATLKGLAPPPVSSTTPVAGPSPQGTVAPEASTAPPTSVPRRAPSTAPQTAASGSGGSGSYMNGVQSYAVGQTGTLWNPDQGVPVATITVTTPTFASTDDAGHSPRYGYFAVFTVTVTDIAPSAGGNDVSPADTDFFASVDGTRYGYGQTNLGMTADAERADALGNGLPSSGLAPGTSTTGTVTIDVPSLHGLLVYAPDGTPLGTWAY
jgi:hypothetical protein